MIAAIGLVAVGLVALAIGAECLVRGAASLALRLGVSSLVVGLTVVAVGTSSPELFVSTGAAVHGDADIAIGNIVGSNIMNLAIILGLTAVIRPTRCNRQIQLREMPVMIGVSILLAAIAWWKPLVQGDQAIIGRADGLLLVSLATAYTFFAYRVTKMEVPSSKEIAELGKESAAPAGARTWGGNLFLIGIGLLLLYVGAEWLLAGAVTLARMLGLSELTIGLTIVAIGTSMPEFATSLIAAIRHHDDISVGNIVGSNIMNVLLILGITCMIAPVHVSSEVLWRDIPVMFVVSLISWPMMVKGSNVSRFDGLLLLMCGFSYIAFLLATSSTSSPTVLPAAP
ncbi:MAG: sodium:calcium antiporter [Planctomycetota bacterium]